jgi:hypothetical protein
MCLLNYGVPVLPLITGPDDWVTVQMLAVAKTAR